MASFLPFVLQLPASFLPQVAILKSDTKAKLAEAEEKMVHALTVSSG
jgi:hypothetical protein